VLIVFAEFVPNSNAGMSPSAAERFSSPAAGTGAKRRLFDSGDGLASSSSSSSRSSLSDAPSQPVPIPMVLVADKTGRQVLQNLIIILLCWRHSFRALENILLISLIILK